MKFKIPKIKLKSQTTLAKSKAMNDYKFTSIIEINKEYKIEGINIWNHYWHCSDRKVEVRGPFEDQVYFFKEYEIQTDQKSLKFVAGEFINGKLGIYLKDDLSDKKL